MNPVGLGSVCRPFSGKPNPSPKEHPMKQVTTAEVSRYREAGIQASTDPTHPLHLLPKVPPGARRILDVGCHAGHTLEALRLPDDCEIFGCDINTEALELARKCLPRATFTPAKAEELPYEDSYFDFVFARGAVATFEIPKALRELNRVLKPGGKLWISLHRWKDILWILKGTLHAHPIKTFLFGTYVVMNSALFHGTGKLIRYPLNRSRILTFQTERRMRRELQKAGFTAIQVSDNKFFVMEADRTRHHTQMS
jgi:ubiquinone/menaquinone biosynthesis C-methylase UbiE